MTELIIRSKDVEALKKLADLARFFGLEAVIPGESLQQSSFTYARNLPIEKSRKPDVLALAGIWKHKNIDVHNIDTFQNQLRQLAWGD